MLDNVRRAIMTLATVLWIVAVILVIAGIFAIIRKQLVWGVVLTRGGAACRPRRGQRLHLTMAGAVPVE
jgi:H+/Cl- antiporter ClcA